MIKSGTRPTIDFINNMNKRKYNKHLHDQYIKQGECCYYCKSKTPYEDITRDHFLPKSTGNTLVNNKIFACRKCNSLKGDKSIDEFREYVLEGIRLILRDVVDSGWKMSEIQLLKFRAFTRILKTTGEIIENGYKPFHIFT